MERQRILLIDDDIDLAKVLSLSLEQAEYLVTIASTTEEIDQELQKEPPDLIILDINLNLPNLDGLELCRELRKELSVPILMLTGSEDDFNKVVALELGANNYLTKPINPRVLVSFVKSALNPPQIKQEDEGGASEVLESKQTNLCFENYVLNVTRHLLTTASGENVSLSPAEFKILSVFAENPKAVLSRDKLLDLIGGNEIYSRSIDSFVSRLRKKLEANPKDPKIIVSIYGVGYLFDTTVTKKTVSDS